MGPPGDLSAAALHIVERDGPSVPLLASASTEASPSSLSRKGCVASLSPLPPEVPVTREGFSLLGCPIGPPSFCEEVLQGRVSKLKESLVLLHEMGDSHLEAIPSLPKFSYVILTCPPSHVSQACWNVDCTIREALESILGGPLTDWSSLPSSRGGFQPAECLAPRPCRFPGIFLALPDASGDNSGT